MIMSMCVPHPSEGLDESYLLLAAQAAKQYQFFTQSYCQLRSVMVWCCLYLSVLLDAVRLGQG